MGPPRLRYDCSGAIDALTRAAAGKRRHSRRRGMWPAELEIARGERLHCTMLDLSAGGARLTFGQPIPRTAQGRIVTLSAEAIGNRWGRLAWISGRWVGIEFLDTTPEALALGRSRADAAFLRRRSETLRGLARGTPNATAAAKLLSSARDFDETATAIETELPSAVAIASSLTTAEKTARAR